MSASPNEIFYAGYNPYSWYGGYDEPWILTPINAEAEKKKPDAVKEDEKKGIIELKVPLCCEGCVEKVRKKLKALEGVASVDCDQAKQKVVVKGDVKREAVLKEAKKHWKRSEFWNEKK